MRSKDLVQVLRKLQQEGWTVEHHDHYKIWSPEGQLFTCSSTPRCPHAHKNLLRDIRKYRRQKK